MKRILTKVLIISVLPLFSQTVQEKYAASITSSDLRKHLEVLASDEYEGRETGMEGQRKAASYIENFFQQLGSPAVVGGKYQQDFPIIIEKPGSSLLLNGSPLRFVDDFFYVGNYADTLIGKLETVFAGYGIETDGYNDYKGLDVKGKIVVVFDGKPVDKNGADVIKGGNGDVWVMDRTKKSKLAAEKGALGMIIVLDDYNKRVAQYKNFIMNPRIRLKKPESEKKRDYQMPVFYLSGEKANTLRLGDKSLATLKEGMKKKGKAVSGGVLVDSFGYDLKRDLKVSSSSNVLGFVEGTDLKDQVLVISAHYDHIGKSGDVVYNGADDDGSGTVAVMELAESFMKAKADGNGPRRSILFLLVSGEEKGLLGSEWYTENPIYPLTNTVCDLNIDMIGRQDKKYESDENYIYVIGSDKLSSELHQISEDANLKFSKLKLDYTYNDPKDPNRYYYRSDHYNFAKNNIPVIFYFNGTHADYHGEGDEVSKINFSKMEKITRLVFHTAWEVANRNDKLKVDKVSDFK